MVEVAASRWWGDWAVCCAAGFRLRSCVVRRAEGEASEGRRPPCRGVRLPNGVVRRVGDCSAPSSDILSEGGARDIHVPLLRNPRPGGRRFSDSLPGLRWGLKRTYPSFPRRREPSAFARAVSIRAERTSLGSRLRGNDEHQSNDAGSPPSWGWLWGVNEDREMTWQSVVRRAGGWRSSGPWMAHAPPSDRMSDEGAEQSPRPADNAPPEHGTPRADAPELLIASALLAQADDDSRRQQRSDHDRADRLGGRLDRRDGLGYRRVR